MIYKEYAWENKMLTTTSEISSTKENTKKYRRNAYSNCPIRMIAHQLRHFYIIAVSRLFIVNKFENLCRIVQYHRVFQKHEKTHDRL